MSEIHPDLKAAVDGEDWATLASIALNARFSDEWCACSDPYLEGDDLMCKTCLRENESQLPKATAAAKRRYEEAMKALRDGGE